MAYKPGAEPNFQTVYRKGSVEEFQTKKTSTGGVYVASPKTCITNLITTSVHNGKELRIIDPEFRHDAPCPEQIYEIFIEAYSKVGSTVLDSFVGSGTSGVGLKMGREIIGYDIDPLSIQFSKKRFEKFLNEAYCKSISSAA